MFKKISEEFKKGTMTLTVQMEEESMAVMVTFKGIELAPVVLRGTPEEIDEKFIELLKRPMNMISDFNEKAFVAELEKALAEKAKKLESEKKEETKKKKEDEKKKADEAKAAQTSLLDNTPGNKAEKSKEKSVGKDDKPVEKPKEKPFAEKVADKANEALGNLKKSPLTEDEITLLKTHLESEEPDPWEAYDFCSKIVAQIRGIKPEEAIDLVNACKVVIEYNKPGQTEEQKHQKNVDAMKKAMTKDEDEFVFDDVPAPDLVASVEDDDDDFEL